MIVYAARGGLIQEARSAFGVEKVSMSRDQLNLPTGSGIDLRLLAASLLVLALSACDKPYAWDGSLEALIASQPEHFATVLENPEKFRVQVIYTQIDRDADNVPSFRSYEYRLNADEYF